MNPVHCAMFAAALAVLTVGCTPRETNENGTATDPARLDDNRFFGSAFRIANLTIWPIVAEQLQELGDFLTLSEAQAQGKAVVKEVDSRTYSLALPAGAVAIEGAQSLELAASADGAQVNALTVENSGDLPILICAGTIVKGGKQDRQIGQDIVIAPNSFVPVEAYCIEAHRWEETRDGVNTASLFQSLPVLAAKDVRASAQYHQDQEGVWLGVQNCNNAAGKSPRTATLLAAVEEVDAKAAAQRTKIEQGIRAHFALLRASGKNTVGFAYAVNGKPVSVRTFAHPKILDGHIETFAKTMCIEADLAGSGSESAADAAPAGTDGRIEDVLQLVKSIGSAPEAKIETKAASTIGLRKNDAGGNSNCYLPVATAPGQVVPVTQDWTSAK